MDNPKYRLPQHADVLTDQIMLCHARKSPITFICDRTFDDDEFLFEEHVLVVSAAVFSDVIGFLTRNGLQWNDCGGS